MKVARTVLKGESGSNAADLLNKLYIMEKQPKQQYKDMEEKQYEYIMYKRYININNRMKEIGVQLYYEEIKDLSRY